MRRDLLALTDDDLAAISNRGTVKRATKELDGAKVELQNLEEREDGTLVFSWSDDATCTLWADRVLKDADCTCPATSICRHIVRSALYYQRQMADAVAEGADLGDEEAEDLAHALEEAHEPWDPGEFTDEEIEAAIPAATLKRAKKLLKAGIVVELTRGIKPTARFHKLGHTLRFQVPGDPRYTQCDCIEEAPCVHTPLAIWAFRELPKGERTGFVSLGADEVRHEISETLLHTAEEQFAQFIEYGFTGTPRGAMDRMQQLEEQLSDGEFVWPAMILGEIRQQYDLYSNHDARFAPGAMADLVGEFLIRAQALNSDKREVPELFIRGSKADRESKMGQARLIGLGCDVVQYERSVVVQALMQDNATGKIVALGHEFTDPAPDDPQQPSTYDDLGERLVINRRDLASLGRSQLVIKKANLSSDHRIALGRAPASAYPQNYEWDKLLTPVLVTDFDEVRHRLSSGPPASLRPRRVGEDLHVAPVARVEGAKFSVRDQAIVATLIDRRDHRATLVHPYTNRNRLGTERLLSWLTQHSDKIEFVSGNMRVGSMGLIINPTGVVFRSPDDESARVMVQPWVDRFDERKAADGELGNARPPLDPVDRFRAELAQTLGELYVLGLNHLDDDTRAKFVRLLKFGRVLGLRDMLTPLADVCTVIDRDSEHEMPTDSVELARPVLDLSVVSRLVQELA